MTLVKRTTGQFPATLQGTVTLTANPTVAWKPGNWIYVGTWGSETFKAKVVKSSTSSPKIIVKNISGTLTSAATVKERNASGSADTGTTGTVATVTTVTGSPSNGGLTHTKGGWNICETDHGITRSRQVGTRTIVEVVHAAKKMATYRADFGTGVAGTANVVTFTLTGGAWSSATTYHYSTKDKVTFTIISSEPVDMDGPVTYPFTITGVGTRNATYAYSSADGLTHTFAYTVTSSDTAGTGFSISTGNFTVPTGAMIKEISGNAMNPLTGTISVSGSLADKTGITITE